MKKVPIGIETAYEALCDLGVALADAGHKWTNEQRIALELAETSLKPLVNPNV